MIAAERIYVSADRRRAVRPDDPDAKVLLAAAGHPLSAEAVKRYGLVDGRLPEPKPRRRKKTAVKKADDSDG